MKRLFTYIIEKSDDSYQDRLDAKIAKQQQKIDKISLKLEKKLSTWNKLLEKYKKNTKLCELIPYEVLDNFNYVTWKEAKELANKLGVEKVMWPYNPAAGDMYSKKCAEVRIKHGITPGTKYEGNEDKYKAAEEDSTYKLLQDFYWNYFTKLNNLCESISSVQKELKMEQDKIISVTDAVKQGKEKKQRESDLFKQVPQLQQFIDEVAEVMLQRSIAKNDKLKEEWKKYNDEIAKLDKQYGDEWSAKVNSKKDNGEGYSKYMELEKTRPTRIVKTDRQLQLDKEEWVAFEKSLLAERITTEFGDVQRVDLEISPKDHNVNGIIFGKKKTARIETIYAGGYNIQCLHTRLLVHEI